MITLKWFCRAVGGAGAGAGARAVVFVLKIRRTIYLSLGLSLSSRVMQYRHKAYKEFNLKIDLEIAAQINRHKV